MGDSRRNTRAVAEVSRVSGSLRRNWNGSRDFGVDRNNPADAAGEFVYCIADVSGSQACPAICQQRLNLKASSVELRIDTDATDFYELNSRSSVASVSIRGSFTFGGFDVPLIISFLLSVPVRVAKQSLLRLRDESIE
jgi:hypothetical protein